jgi:hypothetical protein
MEHVHADEQLTEGTRLGVCFSQNRFFFAVNRNQEITLTVEPQRTLNIAVHCTADQQMLASGPFFQKIRKHNKNNFKTDIPHLHHIKTIPSLG